MSWYLLCIAKIAYDKETMGFESFNALPPQPETSPVEHAPEPAPESLLAESVPEAVLIPEASDIEIQKEPAIEAVTEPAHEELSDDREKISRIKESEVATEYRERTKFVQVGLDSAAESTSRIRRVLQDRRERRLDEFYSPNLERGLLHVSESLTALAHHHEPSAAEIGDALDRMNRGLDDPGPSQRRGPVRDDTENLRHLVGSMRGAQDAFSELSSRLMNHPDEAFRSLKGKSDKIRDRFGDAALTVMRRRELLEDRSRFGR
jgi:hypothetical protein